ncbi:MAG: ribonuclease III domain-containing protein [Vampirovibrionales bacterium]
MTLPDANHLTPAVAAYLGDAIYELSVRQWGIAHLSHNHTLSPKQLHAFTTQRVSAAYQARVLQALCPLLNPQETEWVRRARNLPTKAAKQGHQIIHRHATALEALVGWWHCHDPKRLQLLEAYWPPEALETLNAQTLTNDTEAGAPNTTGADAEREPHRHPLE